MLENLVQELKKQINSTPSKKEESETVKKIRKEYESMDDAYWMNRAQTMRRQEKMFQRGTPEYELWVEKVVTEFQIDEIKYEGYRQILEQPEKIKEITNDIKEKTKEHIKYLECLENIRSGLQLKLDLETE